MESIVSTNQSIQKYYDLYRDSEVVFTKDIIRLLRLDVRQVYVKCAGNQWPCLINSTSFQMVKIILSTSGGAYKEIIKKDAPPINVRFCFVADDGTPVFFFVICRVLEVVEAGKDLSLVTLTFTARPPDDLIMKLGTLLDANHGFEQNKDKRILINDESLKALGIERKETTVFISEVPRRCILWDTGFAGARVLIMGLAKFLSNKECALRFEFTDPDETIDVKGLISQAEPLEGRADICQTQIAFNESDIPFTYKVRINNYWTRSSKPKNAVNTQTQAADPVGARSKSE